MSNREDLGKLLLRVTLAVIVLFHGIFKLTHGVAWIEQPLAAFGLPGFLAYGTYVAEVVAPLLIAVGYRARLAALVIGFDMLMAIVLVLRTQIFRTSERSGAWGIEVEAMILLVSLAVFCLGSGRYRLGGGRWD